MRKKRSAKRSAACGEGVVCNRWRRTGMYKPMVCSALLLGCYYWIRGLTTSTPEPCVQQAGSGCVDTRPDQDTWAEVMRTMRIIYTGAVAKNAKKRVKSRAERDADARQVMKELNAMQDVCSDCLQLDDAKLLQLNTSSTRKFYSEWCDETEFTLADVMPVFASHALEWNKMGKDNAWWSVLTTEKFKGKTISAEAKREFYDSGKSHVSQIMAGVHTECKETGILEECTALDFGCGLGRLAFSMTDWFDKVTCVDQSAYHLQTASRELKLQQRTNHLQPKGRVEFVVSSPNLLEAVGEQQYDFVHSVIALQHMVAPLQQVYLEQMCDVLKPGGQGWVQIPIFIPALYGNMPHGSWKSSCNLDSSIERGGMQMHFTPSPHIESMLKGRGCTAQVLQCVHANCFVGDTITGAIALFQKGEPDKRFSAMVTRMRHSFELRSKADRLNKYPGELKLMSYTFVPHLFGGRRTTCEGMYEEVYRRALCRKPTTAEMENECSIFDRAACTYQQAVQGVVQRLGTTRKCSGPAAGGYWPAPILGNGIATAVAHTHGA